MLAKVQRGLEALYRLDSAYDVSDFLIDEDTRQKAGVARSPREQLLVKEDADGVFLGLFLDRAVLTSLDDQDATVIHSHRFGDFLMLLEGVSHFVYVTFKASANHNVSALELELQAEVDKYVTCLLADTPSRETSRRVRKRLFEDFVYEEDLEPHEEERYRLANRGAQKYSESLERRYVRHNRVADMLKELRRFYRLSLRHKFAFIHQAA